MNEDQPSAYITEYWQCDDEDAGLESDLLCMLKPKKTGSCPAKSDLLSGDFKALGDKKSKETEEIKDIKSDSGKASPRIIITKIDSSISPKMKNLQLNSDGYADEINMKRSESHKLIDFNKLAHSKRERVKTEQNDSEIDQCKTPTRLAAKRSLADAYSLKLISPTTPEAPDEIVPTMATLKLKRDLSRLRQGSNSLHFTSVKNNSESSLLPHLPQIKGNLTPKPFNINVSSPKSNDPSSTDKESPNHNLFSDYLERTDSQNHLQKYHVNIDILKPFQGEISSPRNKNNTSDQDLINNFKLPRIPSFKLPHIQRTPSHSTSSDASNSSWASNNSQYQPHFNVGLDPSKKSKFFDGHNTNEGSVFKVVAMANLNPKMQN